MVDMPIVTNLVIKLIIAGPIASNGWKSKLSDIL